jgi:hypothetical protein
MAYLQHRDRLAGDHVHPQHRRDKSHHEQQLADQLWRPVQRAGGAAQQWDAQQPPGERRDPDPAGDWDWLGRQQLCAWGRVLLSARRPSWTGRLRRPQGPPQRKLDGKCWWDGGRHPPGPPSEPQPGAVNAAEEQEPAGGDRGQRPLQGVLPRVARGAGLRRPWRGDQLREAAAFRRRRRGGLRRVFRAQKFIPTQRAGSWKVSGTMAGS